VLQKIWDNPKIFYLSDKDGKNIFLEIESGLTEEKPTYFKQITKGKPMKLSIKTILKFRKH
jgi:hypothetical protein